MGLNPLTDADLQAMKAVIDSTPEFIDFLRHCQACGLDATDRIEAAQAQCDFCQKVIARFFPDHAG